MSMAATENLVSLLSLPDHLRKTMLIMQIHPYGTAEEVARETKRARAVESSYLNQLTLMGLLEKERKGRKAFFHARTYLWNGRGEALSLYKKLKEMSSEFRELICEDMLTAFQNRVNVFARIQKN